MYTKSAPFLVFLGFIIGFIVTGTATAAGVGDSCLDCHGNAARMTELGYPHFTITNQEAAAQTGMPASCSNCHLGDRSRPDREGAHQGLKRLVPVKKKGLVAAPGERTYPLGVNVPAAIAVPTLTIYIDKEGKKVPDSSLSTFVYHDKRLDTLSQDFTVMEKTCGTCHPQEFKEFLQSTMARNGKQSRYRTWADSERGPHNCGVWFVGNYERISANTGVPFSADNNALNQRTCNTCHVGCLDCHYSPMEHDPTDPKKGIHTFLKTPRPASCYSGGRGTYCHAGPEERRRGAGYFGGAEAFPEGAEPDVHLKAGVGCLDCHPSSKTDKRLGHGMVKRQARCDHCHGTIVKSHAASRHRKLTCEACHIREVGGYQATFWGPGQMAGYPTPFYKYKGYYGIMKDSILIRDQKGRWIPVKPFPMAVLNQKAAPLKPGLHWRWPKELPDLERTDDAYAYVGLADGLPENNQALLWIQLDKLSHKYGKSRPCESCHTDNGVQRQEVTWEYSDNGALPFSGSHTVLAERTGLSIKGMKNEDTIEVSEGYSLSSLAPWVFLKDRWFVSGNFALPKVKDQRGYDTARKDPAKARTLKVLHH